jgi:iron complex outermembrane recepter protein
MRSRTRSSPIMRLAIGCLVLSFSRIVAGQTVAAGAISGFITDPDAARLPGVVVTLTEVSTGSSVTVITGEHGGYRAAGLRPGRYELSAELAGFQPNVVRDLSVAEAQTREVDVRLSLATYAEAVTVIGTAARVSVQPSEVRDSTARDIGEAMSHVNGVTKIRKGGIGNDIVLHGYQGRDLTVLIDGQKVYGACPNNMDPAVFHADFAEVDHIEVGKGPFDMFNQGSLGGVVNVVTRKPADGFHAEPTFSAGSFGYVNPAATASWGGRNVSLLGGYSYRSSDPYRDGSGARFTEYANYRSENAAAQAFSANTGWAHLFVSPETGHTIHLSYTRQHAADVLYPYLQMDAIGDTADRLRAGYERTIPDARIASISADAYYTRVAHSMTDEFRASSVGSPRPYSMITDAESSIGGAKVQVKLAAMTAGVEGSRRRWNAATSMAMNQFQPQYAIPDVTTDSIGAYVSYTRSLSDAMQLDAGGRVDWARSAADAAKANANLYFAYHSTRSTSATDLMPSANIRLSARASEHLKIAGGFGHTERVPDAQERYYGLARMGTDWVGNPLLPPTGNTGLNADITYQRGRVAASGAIYHDWLSDFITPIPITKINSASGVMNTRARSYDSVNARMTSGEANITYSLSSRLFATAKAAYTRGTKDPLPALGLTSGNLAEMPPLNGSVALRYDRATMFGQVEVAMAASQPHVDADVLEATTAGYGVLNLRVGRQIKALRVTFDIDNVFDRLYLDYLSYQRDPFRSTVRVREPGRNLYVNISYRY